LERILGICYITAAVVEGATPEWAQGRRLLDPHRVVLLEDPQVAAGYYGMVDAAGLSCVLALERRQANFEKRSEDGHLKALTQERLVPSSGCPAVDAVAEPLALALALVLVLVFALSNRYREVQPQC
jgi:hypothetical protein